MMNRYLKPYLQKLNNKRLDTKTLTRKEKLNEEPVQQRHDRTLQGVTPRQLPRIAYKEPTNPNELVRILQAHTLLTKKIMSSPFLFRLFWLLHWEAVILRDAWSLCLHKIAEKDRDQCNNHHKHEWETTTLLAHLFPQDFLHTAETSQISQSWRREKCSLGFYVPLKQHKLIISSKWWNERSHDP